MKPPSLRSERQFPLRQTLSTYVIEKLLIMSRFFFEMMISLVARLCSALTREDFAPLQRTMTMMMTQRTPKRRTKKSDNDVLENEENESSIHLLMLRLFVKQIAQDTLQQLHEIQMLDESFAELVEKFSRNLLEKSLRATFCLAFACCL